MLERHKIHDYFTKLYVVLNFAGILSLPQIANAIPGQQKLLIDENRQVTVDDIETGLKIAIKRGYTHSNDPIVPKIRQLLALLRTNKVTISEAAKSVDVPLEVILELGKMAINQRYCQKLIPDC
jgi:hypothetical protein